MEKSLYEILEIDVDSNDVRIKQAYKKKLLDLHPDKNSESINEAYRINEIQTAYRVLIDPIKRLKYDEELENKCKIQGFYNNGDGLDEYSLDNFHYHEDRHIFTMDCPRCQIGNGFQILEHLLEEYAVKRENGGFNVLLQCTSCSLWLKINFNIVEESDSP